LTYCFKFEGQVQRSLVLHRALLIRAAQTLVDKTQVETSEMSFFDCAHGNAPQGQDGVEE